MTFTAFAKGKNDIYGLCNEEKSFLLKIDDKLIYGESRASSFQKNVFHVKGYVISVKMVQKRILFIYQCCDQRLPKLDSSMHPF